MVALSALTRWGIAALMVAAVIVFLYRIVFSPQARDRRRRNRNYGRVVTRKRKIANVRFNASTPRGKNRDKP